MFLNHHFQYVDAIIFQIGPHNWNFYRRQFLQRQILHLYSKNDQPPGSRFKLWSGNVFSYCTRRSQWYQIIHRRCCHCLYTKASLQLVWFSWLGPKSEQTKRKYNSEIVHRQIILFIPIAGIYYMKLWLHSNLPWPAKSTSFFLFVSNLPPLIRLHCRQAPADTFYSYLITNLIRSQTMSFNQPTNSLKVIRAMPGQSALVCLPLDNFWI